MVEKDHHKKLGGVYSTQMGLNAILGDREWIEAPDEENPELRSIETGATHMALPTEETDTILGITPVEDIRDYVTVDKGMTTEAFAEASRKMEEVLYDQRGLTVEKLSRLAELQQKGEKPKLKILVVGSGTGMQQYRTLVGRLEESGVDYSLVMVEYSQEQIDTSELTAETQIPELVAAGEVQFFANHVEGVDWINDVRFSTALNIQDFLNAHAELGDRFPKISTVRANIFDFLRMIQQNALRDKLVPNLVECPESIMHFKDPEINNLSFLRSLTIKNRAMGRANFISELTKTINGPFRLDLNDCGMNWMGKTISAHTFSAYLLEMDEYPKYVYPAVNKVIGQQGLEISTIAGFDLTDGFRQVNDRGVAKHIDYLLGLPDEEIAPELKRILRKKRFTWAMLEKTQSTYYNLVARIGYVGFETDMILDLD